MPAGASFLSSPKYGYDFVVATTQMSINGTLLNFLSSRKEPTVDVCYVADDDGIPQQVSYEDLKKAAKGTDPFSMSATVDPKTDPNFKNLFGAKFLMGFRAKLGIPKVSDPSKLPDIVTLGSDTGAVTFNMLCSEFTIVRLDPGNGFGSKPSWMRADQPVDKPWIFSSKVDLRLSTVTPTAYSTLPPDVQGQIKNMSGTAFSVQQLLFDLTNARLATLPNITGIAPGTIEYLVMQQYFIGAYFTQLAKDGQPLLGCSVVPRTASAATMTLTNMNMQVSPFVGSDGQPIPRPDLAEANLATLNYLCAADGASLPAAVPFNWNWVDKSQASDHHGVLSINRNTFANYFREQLKTYVPNNCLAPKVRVWQDGLTTWYQWGFTSGQSPTVTPKASGKDVLTYSYDSKSYDEAGINGALGAMSLQTSFDLTLSFSGNQITIKQRSRIDLYFKIAATSNSGTIFDKTITDVYTIGINAQGQLESAAAAPKVEDKSSNVKTNWFENIFTDFNRLSGDVKSWTSSFASRSLTDIPVDSVRRYVFPGGQTFTFKSAQFSDKQDLTALITYSDPTKPFTVPNDKMKAALPARPL